MDDTFFMGFYSIIRIKQKRSIVGGSYERVFGEI